jgi:predicted RND superfamily exporter protein
VALQAQLARLEGIVQPAGLPRVAEDGTALVSFLLAPSGTSAREELFAEAEDAAREAGWVEAHATGMAVRTARDSGAIVRGELRGLLATFLALGPCIWIGLRSVRLTLVGLAANTLPCLALHGGLALAGRPMSVASAMIGSVVLGLVVDQAIYFLHGFRGGLERTTPRVAVARTLRHSGRAMTVTSLVLALGFLAGVAGQLTTTREFGILAAGSILTAWIANVWLLPTLLLAVGPRSRSGPPRLPS